MFGLPITYVLKWLRLIPKILGPQRLWLSGYLQRRVAQYAIQTGLDRGPRPRENVLEVQSGLHLHVELLLQILHFHYDALCATGLVHRFNCLQVIVLFLLKVNHLLIPGQVMEVLIVVDQVLLIGQNLVLEALDCSHLQHVARD